MGILLSDNSVLHILLTPKYEHRVSGSPESTRIFKVHILSTTIFKSFFFKSQTKSVTEYKYEKNRWLEI